MRVHLGACDEGSPRPRLLAVNEQIVEHSVFNTLVCLGRIHPLFVVNEQATGIRLQIKLGQQLVGNDDGTRITAHRRVGDGRRIFVRLIGCGLERMPAQGKGMAASHILGVQVDQLAAHITREQILVAANAHRLLAHHLAQFVVLARRRHKQTHRIGIATPERLGKLFAHGLAHFTWSHRRIRAAERVTQIRIDLHMLTGNIGDIDLLAGLVVVVRRLALNTVCNVIGIDTIAVPCGVQIDRCIGQHHAIGFRRIDVLFVVVERIGRVIDIRLRHVNRVIALQVFVHHVGNRHTARHRGDGQKQEHRDDAHRKAHRVDLGRKLAHGKHVEAAPIHAAQALQQLDEHARESPEQGKGAHGNHSGRNTKLVHGLLQLAVRRG